MILHMRLGICMDFRVEITFLLLKCIDGATGPDVSLRT
jgi:hypothetical protein